MNKVRCGCCPCGSSSVLRSVCVATNVHDIVHGHALYLCGEEFCMQCVATRGIIWYMCLEYTGVEYKCVVYVSGVDTG